MRSIWKFLKKWPKLTILTVVCIAGIVWLLMRLSAPKAPIYITEPVIQGDLIQKVEATATIVSERDLKLQFPLTGVIERVLVQEGDIVKAGQELARLRSSGLIADVNSAAAGVAQAKADLQNIEAGTRQEQLAVTEASIANKESSVRAAQDTLVSAKRTLEQAQVRLEALKTETSTNLQGSVDSVRSSVSSQLANLLTGVQTFSSLLDDVILRDVLVRYNATLLSTWNSKIDAFAREVVSQQNKFSQITDYNQAILALESIRQTAQRLSDFYNQAILEGVMIPNTSTFTIAKRDAIRTSILSLQSSVQGTLTGLDANLQTLKNTPVSIESRIAAEEANIISAQNAIKNAQSTIEGSQTILEIEKANLRLQQAGNRPGDIAAARARLNQAYATLQRAQERFNDTIIRAPIDGLITKVNLKAGELLSTSFASESAISMLGNASYRIELYVPEIDVPNVRIGQSGSLALDSFADVTFPLTLSELEPTSTTIDGVAKYRAVLDFPTNIDQNQFKIGMTGDAEIVTAMRSNVLQIPARAVRRNELGKEVVGILDALNQVQTVQVRTGLEGAGGQLEIQTGLEVDQLVIILQK